MALKSQHINASDIVDVVKMFYQTKRVVGFFGAPGIAKTAMVRKAAQEMSVTYGEHVEVHELHLASISEVDVRGYLIPDGTNARFTAPSFWPAVLRNNRGILFLDEFPQAPHEVQKAVAPLILDRRIGDFELPEGWIVVIAGNRMDDQSGANSLLAHVMNRLFYIEVDAPDVDRWMIWATEAQMAPELIAFAKLRPQCVFGATVPDGANEPFCTPRSLHALSDICHAYPGGVRAMISDEVGMALCNGAIGVGASAELAGVVRTAMKLPTFEEICANPDTARVPDVPDEAYAAAMLVAVRADYKKHGDAPVRYIARFNPNFVLVGLVALVNRDKNFSNCKAMGDWVRANQSLVKKFHKYITINA